MEDLSLTAEELRDIRARLDWSQQRMADELDVARNTINRMEKGHMAIEKRTALAVRYLAWHHAMIEKVSRQQLGQETAPASARERGDGHKQVDLPLPSPSKSSTRSNPVADAWQVFWDLRCSRQGVHLLEENYFKLAKATKIDYSYLFMLQLLERLFSLPVPWNSCAPAEWIQFKALRAFADKLYKANPQWH
ncbi:helix-turn-helix transcriptional regulator [Aeromonas veronii]|uniref:helix-turn-helix transcriptional regulator n=1 Tax=Aeromonas veronii TaxID=654 RepID=UPI003BA37A36